jgi:hypothetical protein
MRISRRVASALAVAVLAPMIANDAHAEVVTRPGPSTGPGAAAGPLVVSAANPRYFTVAGHRGRRVVYLTGSHIWNNFHDGLGPGAACAETPEQNSYPAYLDFLKAHGHNFIRLWRWEHFASQAPVEAPFHLCMTPQPWPRTGPGTASDGKPRFDLSTFDQEYFDRLRDRVIAAGNKGIYVSVMFFDGFCLQLCRTPNNIEGHPFAAANNVNGIGITSNVDYQVLPLDARIRALQQAYLRKVVDTVHDLPNVLYEVANETLGDSTQWQYEVINFVKRYERRKGYERHPVGMTMQFPVQDQSKVNEPLFNGPADWISPGFDDELFTGRWYTDPPANDGTKVVISDTDHYAAGSGDALWAWKTFLRGHNPILMDFGIIDVVNPLDPSTGVPSYEFYEPARYAMGDTFRYARRAELVDMKPRGDLTSTGYALADPGEEYLVLQAGDTGGPFTVTLPPGTYTVEWHSVGTRDTTRAGTVRVANAAATRFNPPSTGPAVLYLNKAGR